ncbi:ribosomal-protein-alanine acetyltransferase [Kushneria pakistanensis]|uniref:Ribosomal-protein-alanine acetyltransferase n=1 Tax=Kushneria pakistanensis TaxID=1508770 RepID=A0ABQ3FKR2_9GAMM|nr:GNAT family N-acetyltransferase [Kushneria pakistanensis]GHC28489.1 ribosomal-protein-alanine acetyltransferase [Kushneria pakistanensis]
MTLVIENVTDARALATLDARVRGSDAWPISRFISMTHDAYDLLGLTDRNTQALLAFAVFSLGPFDIGLEMIAVDPDHRRQGLAGRLIEAMIDKGEAMGLERVLLEVRASNEAAQALYARYGFSVDGRRAGYYPLAPGRREDAILMSRPLTL